MSSKKLTPIDPTVKIPRAKQNRVTKQLLIEQLQAFYKRFGVVPMSSHLDRVKGFATLPTFYAYLGDTWDEVLRAADLPASEEQKEMRRKEYLEKLVRFRKLYGRAPKTSELNSKFDMPSYNQYRNLFKDSWEGILARVDMVPFVSRAVNWSRDDLGHKITEYYLHYGPRYREGHAGQMGLPALQTIQIFFGKDWSEIIKDLGFVEDSEDDDIKEALIRELLAFYRKHGRRPLSKELRLKSGTHSYACYRKVFKGKTLDEMLTEAGLPDDK